MHQRRRLVPVCRVAVPANYASVLAGLRLRLGLSQQQLANKVGAASKAVIYQWESGKRKPSPVSGQLIAGCEQFLLVDDVVAVEDGAGLVPGEEHGDAFGDAADWTPSTRVRPRACAKDLDETLTVIGLRLSERLQRSLATTKAQGYIFRDYVRE